jgi:hypothetical protein
VSLDLFEDGQQRGCSVFLLAQNPSHIVDNAMGHNIISILFRTISRYRAPSGQAKNVKPER